MQPKTTCTANNHDDDTMHCADAAPSCMSHFGSGSGRLLSNAGQIVSVPTMSAAAELALAGAGHSANAALTATNTLAMAMQRQ